MCIDGSICYSCLPLVMLLVNGGVQKSEIRILKNWFYSTEIIKEIESAIDVYAAEGVEPKILLFFDAFILPAI